MLQIGGYASSISTRCRTAGAIDIRIVIGRQDQRHFSKEV